MATLTLVIGNKNYSSWSMRAWLFMKHSGIVFDEENIPMFTDKGLEKLAPLSPTGFVPALVDKSNGATVWDSLGVVTYLREGALSDCVGYPTQAAARAHAMSVVGEVHSGFGAVRRFLPFNLKRKEAPRTALDEGTQKQLARLETLWCEGYDTHGQGSGLWMYGTANPTLADIFLVPFALRIRSYDLEKTMGNGTKRFLAAIDSDAHCQQWIREALAETEVIERMEGNNVGSYVPAGTG